MQLTLEDLTFHRRLGHLIEKVDGEEFWPAFAAFLREHICFDSWVVMIFQQDDPPLLVHEGDTTNIEDELFGKYIRKFYVDDPFYQFSQRNAALGVYRLDEIAPSDFRVSEYFWNYFRSNVTEDEIQLLTPYVHGSDKHGVLSLSLGAKRHFSNDEYGLLVLMSAWLLPLLKLATRATLSDIHMPEKQYSRSNIEARLREITSPNLTEREIETALLLLSGQSTKGIAAHLGISPETVKVHRRNLYEKLGVTSQAEIFARYWPLES